MAELFIFSSVFSFLSTVVGASPLQTQSNGQVRFVQAQKCRFEYCLFSLLSISVYIFVANFVSTGENVSPPKLVRGFRVKPKNPRKKQKPVEPRNPNVI